jgi:hypothetical protein
MDLDSQATNNSTLRALKALGERPEGLSITPSGTVAVLCCCTQAF